jgi:ankyrin repeat protein
VTCFCNPINLQDICEIDAVTHAGMTALHIAVHQGHSRIVERLVGFGANLNAQDSDGDTPLHLTLLREAVDTLSADTPQLKKVF